MQELSGGMEVWQSNALVEACQSMTLNEKRILYAAAALHDQRKPVPAKGTVRFHADEFAEIFGLDLRGKGRYEDLKAAAERLYHRNIKSIRCSSAGKIIRNMRWVWMSEYSDGEATVTLGFSPPVLPYLTMLSAQFTRFKLRHIGNISSQYGLRIYEICAQYRSIGSRKLTIAELRNMLDLTDKYPSVKDLRVRVLDPAIAEVNEHTDLRVVMTAKRKGRKVIGFDFAIKLEAQLALDLM